MKTDIIIETFWITKQIHPIVRKGWAAKVFNQEGEIQIIHMANLSSFILYVYFFEQYSMGVWNFEKNFTNVKDKYKYFAEILEFERTAEFLVNTEIKNQTIEWISD